MTTKASAGFELMMYRSHFILLIRNVVSITGQSFCVDMIIHFKRCIWLLYFPSDETLLTSEGYTKQSEYIVNRVALIWLYVCQHFYQLFKKHRIKIISSLNVGQRMSIIILLLLVVIVQHVYKLKVLHKRTVPGFPFKISSLSHNWPYTVVDCACAFGRGFCHSWLRWFFAAPNIHCRSDWECNVGQTDVWRVSRMCYVTYNFVWSKTNKCLIKRFDIIMLVMRIFFWKY